jgi:hypothetical protein
MACHRATCLRRHIAEQHFLNSKSRFWNPCLCCTRQTVIKSVSRLITLSNRGWIRATCGPAISSRLQQRIRTTLSRGGDIVSFRAFVPLCLRNRW